ncbi:MAG: hypothetical protein ACR2PA_18375, partial [Hyphomicrobiaceae bacterium]
MNPQHEDYEDCRRRHAAALRLVWMKFEALLRVRSEAIELIPAPAKSRTSVDKLVRKKVIKPIDKE